MSARPLPEMIFLFVLLLHNSAYGQLRGGATEWRTFEVPEFGTRVQFRQAFSLPLVNPNEGVVSDLSELMVVQP